MNALVATGPGEAPGEVVAEPVLAPATSLSKEPAAAPAPAAPAAPGEDEPPSLLELAQARFRDERDDAPAEDVPAEAADVPGFGPTVEAPPQPEVEASGVVGEPVPSQAPSAFVQEQSLEVEQEDVPAPAAEPAPAPVGVLPDDFGRPERPTELTYTAPAVDGSAQTTRSSAPALDGVVRADGEQGRNELCACGSGKKYKRCHGDPRNR